MIQTNMPGPFYRQYPPNTPQQKKDKLVIILLTTILGISVLLNIILGLIAIGAIGIGPANKTYTVYNSQADINGKVYSGELVQFRVDPYTLTAIKGKNEYMWRFGDKDYGIVLRFPATLKPVATGIGLYSGKVLPYETYGENTLRVIQIDEVKG